MAIWLNENVYEEKITLNFLLMKTHIEFDWFLYIYITPTDIEYILLSQYITEHMYILQYIVQA